MTPKELADININLERLKVELERLQEAAGNAQAEVAAAYMNLSDARQDAIQRMKAGL